MNTNQTCGMTDKETLTDLLNCQKHLCATYNTYCTETATPEMRGTMLSLLRDAHEMQGSLFATMQTKGWYPTEKAEEQKLQKTKQQFMQYAKM